MASAGLSSCERPARRSDAFRAAWEYRRSARSASRHSERVRRRGTLDRLGPTTARRATFARDAIALRESNLCEADPSTRPPRWFRRNAWLRRGGLRRVFRSLDDGMRLPPLERI